LQESGVKWGSCLVQLWLSSPSRHEADCNIGARTRRYGLAASLTSFHNTVLEPLPLPLSVRSPCSDYWLTCWDIFQFGSVSETGYGTRNVSPRWKKRLFFKVGMKLSDGCVEILKTGERRMYTDIRDSLSFVIAWMSCSTSRRVLR